jgi:hypothetical protein
MRRKLHLLAGVVLLMTTTLFTGCNADDDFLGGVPVTQVIDFANVPSAYKASDKYGNNLYSGSANQITTGYMEQLGQSGTYVQFPINYLSQGWVSEQPWSYDYWNGGIAISDFTDMTDGTYLNQCSVYDASGGVGGGTFAVAFGYSDSYNDPNATYDMCSKIYLTDSIGYKVVTTNEPVEGTAKSGHFNSVYVCNTTYGYLAMRDGNDFTTGSLQSQNGWFKVQFIGLDASGVKTGTVESYLANFDPALVTVSGLNNTILIGWKEVDLTGLGNSVSTVVINFVGSDAGEYGLNTPAYCALDNLSITNL